MGDGLRPVPALATGRHLASHLRATAGPGRRRGTDYLGRLGGLDHRPHPPACGGCPQKGDLQVEPPGGVFTEPADHGLGRSRGGLTTKLHLTVEQAQKPMSLVITAGQRGDSPQFQVVLGRIRVPRLGPGRPRTRPDKVRADKAYGSRANRAYLRKRGIHCTIPEKRDQIANRKKHGPHGGRPPKFDTANYKDATRWSAESITSSTTARSPRDTTSSPSATKRPCRVAAINEWL
ncbi:transposase [Streptomyces sp. NPDC048275]|uniref:transposase n=1 Tax=Streptomyces sp. NPDC048275 TaxID=3155629 RepID=UPI0033EC2850